MAPKTKPSKKPKPSRTPTKRKSTVTTVNYEPFLLKDLKDIDYAAGYLTAALEEGADVFLLAVRQVAKAQGGMTALSEATELNRENLYDMLSKDGNPRLASLTSILDKLGFKVQFSRKLEGKRAA